MLTLTMVLVGKCSTFYPHPFPTCYALKVSLARLELGHFTWFGNHGVAMVLQLLRLQVLGSRLVAGAAADYVVLLYSDGGGREGAVF